jgi:pantoate kinase
MTTAYCPAHITCFFRPVVSSGNVLEKGSKGVGVRLGKGSTVHAEETGGAVRITINGRKEDARITRHVLGHMAPGRSFEVNVECGLPIGQGFGMSASGAVAVALCIAEITGKSRTEAFEAAHRADAICGGGLGDVAGLMHEGDVPIRIREGLPPFGRVYDAGISFERMTLVVLGDKLSTAGVLGNKSQLNKISESGDNAMIEFNGHMAIPKSESKEDSTKDLLFNISNKFSSEAGIRGPAVAEAMRILDKNGIRSSMCMLGNSIFTDAPEEEVRRALGGRGMIFSTSSTGEPARIIRRE